MRERELVKLISDAAAGGEWRAAAWLLERRYPERWTRRSQPPAEATESAGPDWLDELADRRKRSAGEA